MSLEQIRPHDIFIQDDKQRLARPESSGNNDENDDRQENMGALWLAKGRMIDTRVLRGHCLSVNEAI
jgi:hypothetical protein